MAAVQETHCSEPNIYLDIKASLEKHKLIEMLSFGEIKRRFKRTILGPFWVTLNLGIFIFAMGWLFASLWNTDMKSFLPFFSSGFIVWMLISTMMSESCHTFTSYESVLQQISLPYMLLPIVTVLRNLIVFFHHLVIFIIIILLFDVKINLNTLLILPGLALLSLAGISVAFILGSVCARYRDIQQVIQSFLQLAVFVTPIFWPPEQLGHKKIIFVTFNPLYHCINIVRKPMMGEAPELLSWIVVVLIGIFAFYIASTIFKKKSQDLVFWL